MNFFLFLGVLALDLLSKFLTHVYLPVMNQDTLWYPYGGIPVFYNFHGITFSICHATNKGMAWGLFAAYQTPMLFLRIAFILALGVYTLFLNRERALAFPLTLVLAGALGNVLDTFFYGHVIDMFHFTFWGYSYPVFNIADSAIFVGVFWLLALSLFTSKQTELG